MTRLRTSVYAAGVAIAALGYVFIERPLQTAIDDVTREREGILAEIGHNIALRENARPLEARLATLQARMHETVLADDPVAATAIFVGEATTVARTFQTRITGFAGRPIDRLASSASPPKIGAASPTVFQTAPIEVTMEGSYANLIGALRSLSHQRIPARVAVMSIERIADQRNAREPVLDARIRVDILYREKVKAIDGSAT
jgi:hypothetical protein